MPALDNEGRIILEQRHRVALAPNGNGGIFEGLQRQGALDDMKANGIEFIHVYGVDNVLAKVGDPTFIGFAVDKKADCANKVVLKVKRTNDTGRGGNGNESASRAADGDAHPFPPLLSSPLFLVD